MTVSQELAPGWEDFREHAAAAWDTMLGRLAEALARP
jgi:hypothetical protein